MALIEDAIKFIQNKCTYFENCSNQNCCYSDTAHKLMGHKLCKKFKTCNNSLCLKLHDKTRAKPSLDIIIMISIAQITGMKYCSFCCSSCENDTNPNFVHSSNFRQVFG